ncbi:Lrp/AsnC family transcriptional regulator [Streptomyces sp. SID3343]|uniref:Lrp/AsnC family transcriptional regulator n=1 Tax=Streptomyces sp. SID3343 TaxID=2690260 RepID=UPI00136DB1F1|nr:Lrp/AsnC family transcriptional regulator [Streptomyces sp. SID3343]MYW05189.1 AsnC family transcriptional regulator [Streptomyces sp. SID3343]
MSPEEASTSAEPGRLVTPLDKTDRAIVAALVDDGRISVRALAERVHISRANAYARVGRMVDDGTISGFTARLNPARVGLGTSAYVTVTLRQNAWRGVCERLRQISYIEHFALVGGDYDVLALVRTPDNTALREVVLEQIQSIPNVLSTRTWLVFEESPGRAIDWAAGP